MTKGQLFMATYDVVKENAEYKKNFTELGKHYSYLKRCLPGELGDMLDLFYACTIGIEGAVMETAFMLGIEQLENARAVQQDAIND
jgi:hypothetical protein